mmetsp:Transcript_870/g.1876  ORF Transcript_870/g.1876 Transcript_870/m.1876 type:complete len:208 (+) Transcript_870:406-1029(+)
MVPHGLKHAVKVPLVLCADRHVVGDAVQQVELLDRDLVDHVADVHGRDVDAHHPDLVRTLDHVEQLVHRAVLTERDLRVVDFVFVQDRFQHLGVDVGGGGGELHVQLDAALFVTLEVDVWFLLVQPDAEAVQLLLNKLLVRHRLGRVQHNQDQRARPRRADDSLPSPLAVLGPLDNPGKVQKLDLGTLIPDDPGNAGQSSELVSCCL